MLAGRHNFLGAPTAGPLPSGQRRVQHSSTLGEMEVAWLLQNAVDNMSRGLVDEAKIYLARATEALQDPRFSSAAFVTLALVASDLWFTQNEAAKASKLLQSVADTLRLQGSVDQHLKPVVKRWIHRFEHRRLDTGKSFFVKKVDSARQFLTLVKGIMQSSNPFASDEFSIELAKLSKGSDEQQEFLLAVVDEVQKKKRSVRDFSPPHLDSWTSQLQPYIRKAESVLERPPLHPTPSHNHTGFEEEMSPVFAPSRAHVCFAVKPRVTAVSPPRVDVTTSSMFRSKDRRSLFEPSDAPSSNTPLSSRRPQNRENMDFVSWNGYTDGGLEDYSGFSQLGDEIDQIQFPRRSRKTQRHGSTHVGTNSVPNSLTNRVDNPSILQQSRSESALTSSRTHPVTPQQGDEGRIHGTVSHRRGVSAASLRQAADRVHDFVADFKADDLYLSGRPFDQAAPTAGLPGPQKPPSAHSSFNQEPLFTPTPSHSQRSPLPLAPSGMPVKESTLQSAIHDFCNAYHDSSLIPNDIGLPEGFNEEDLSEFTRFIDAGLGDLLVQAVKHYGGQATVSDLVEAVEPSYEPLVKALCAYVMFHSGGVAGPGGDRGDGISRGMEGSGRSSGGVVEDQYGSSQGEGSLYGAGVDVDDEQTSAGGAGGTPTSLAPLALNNTSLQSREDFINFLRRLAGPSGTLTAAQLYQAMGKMIGSMVGEEKVALAAKVLRKEGLPGNLQPHLGAARGISEAQNDALIGYFVEEMVQRAGQRSGSQPRHRGRFHGSASSTAEGTSRVSVDELLNTLAEASSELKPLQRLVLPAEEITESQDLTTPGGITYGTPSTFYPFSPAVTPFQSSPFPSSLSIAASDKAPAEYSGSQTPVLRAAWPGRRERGTSQGSERGSHGRLPINTKAVDAVEESSGEHSESKSYLTGGPRLPSLTALEANEEAQLAHEDAQSVISIATDFEEFVAEGDAGIEEKGGDAAGAAAKAEGQHRHQGRARTHWPGTARPAATRNASGLGSEQLQDGEEGDVGEARGYPEYVGARTWKEGEANQPQSLLSHGGSASLDLTSEGSPMEGEVRGIPSQPSKTRQGGAADAGDAAVASTF